MTASTISSIAGPTPVFLKSKSPHPLILFDPFLLFYNFPTLPPPLDSHIAPRTLMSSSDTTSDPNPAPPPPPTPSSTFTQQSLPRPRSIQASISEMALNGLAEYRSSYLNRNEDGTYTLGGPSPAPIPTSAPVANDQLPREGSSVASKPPLSPRHLANMTFSSSQPTSPSSSQGFDDSDRARYQSIMRASKVRLDEERSDDL